ncbi:phage tail tape measure protein, TP901 family, core region [Pseudovibrio ascidiaceicola]|uniref:Phage tail tape measure protein, TP901 family, core region n=1 Tax=Pseudovibrio ascidiaceicola TaxID=285279 RepID=A0A1I4DX53_9HYPH|nr:phage tail tape measure protein [Pseudovibrio ascidiaceicola]SFK98134.1 phage tail tape measure protein, TP901 family, core region [Pseudovibrio ascidiaceicola]
MRKIETQLNLRVVSNMTREFQKTTGASAQAAKKFAELWVREVKTLNSKMNQLGDFKKLEGQLDSLKSKTKAAYDTLSGRREQLAGLNNQATLLAGSYEAASERVRQLADRMQRLKAEQAETSKQLASNQAARKALEEQMRAAKKAKEPIDGLKAAIAELKAEEQGLKATRAAQKEQLIGLNAETKEAGQEAKTLSKQLASTTREVKKVGRAYHQAEEGAEKLSRETRKVSKSLTDMKNGLRSAGMNVKDLTAEERKLTAAMDKTSEAIDAQNTKLSQQKKAAQVREQKQQAMKGKAVKAGAIGAGGAAAFYGGQRALRAWYNPVDVAIDVEDAFAGVKAKTTFENEEEEKKFKQATIDKSTKIAMPLTELFALQEEGSGAGIAKEDLMRFTELAGKTGVAFDLDGGLTGKVLAKTKTALGTDLDGLSDYVDAVNHLSNKTSSQAPDLLNYFSRVAGRFGKAGFTQNQTLALGSSMIASNFAPEVVATTFKNVINTLSGADTLSKDKREAFQEIGMDPVQVAKDMQVDAFGTLLKVIEKLGSVEEYRRLAIENKLFGQEAAAFGGLTANVQLLKDTYKLVENDGQYDPNNDYAGYKGSAEAEFKSRSATTQNEQQLMFNELYALKAEFGETMLPVVRAVSKSIREFLAPLRQWVRENPDQAKLAGTIAAVVAGLVAVGGALTTLVATATVAAFGLKMATSTIKGRRASSLLGEVLLGEGADGTGKKTGSAGKAKKGLWSSVGGILGKAGRLAGAVTGALAYREVAEAGAGGLDWAAGKAFPSHAEAGQKADLLQQKQDEYWDTREDWWQRYNPLAETPKELTAIRDQIYGPRETKTQNAFAGDLATAKEKLAFVDDKIAKVKGTPLEASQLMTLNRMREQLTQTIAKLEKELQASQIAQALQQKADQIKAVAVQMAMPQAKPVPAFAKGGVTGRGPALVGENGPEYIWTDKGQYVSNNNQLKQIRALAASAAIAMPLGLSLPQPPTQAALFTPPAVQQQGAGGSARSAPLVGELHVHVPGGSGRDARSLGRDVGRETVKAIRQYHSDGGI